jgi:hypothetical protein
MCTVEKLSVLHICINDNTLHPDLISYIDSLPISKEYKGQNKSRIKMLVRNLPWPVKDNENDAAGTFTLEEQLPDHLRAVWCFLPRVTHSRRSEQSLNNEWDEEYLLYRSTQPLSGYASVLLC